MTAPPSAARRPPLRTDAQFMRFVVVGGTGFVVNLAAFQALLWLVGRAHDVAWDVPGTDFHVRFYHLFAIAAFVAANTSNYVLNRRWTFRSHGLVDWREEYLPFLIVGVVAQAIGLLLLTVFLHPDSPVRLDSELLAQAVTIVLVTPVNFAGNKWWTFRTAERHQRYGTSGS
jgi:putative flippase GtrA